MATTWRPAARVSMLTPFALRSLLGLLAPLPPAGTVRRGGRTVRRATDEEYRYSLVTSYLGDGERRGKRRSRHPRPLRYVDGVWS